MRYKIERLLARLLHRFFKLYSVREVCSMIEEVANDLRCERYLREVVSDEYLSIYMSIHAELVNAALLDNEECKFNDLCTECREIYAL